MKVFAGPFVTCILAVAVSQTFAQPAFYGVGDLSGGTQGSGVYGVSRDGSVAVGSSDNVAIRWTRSGGMMALEDLNDPHNPPQLHKAVAASADGSVIAAEGGWYQAYRWTAGGAGMHIPNLGAPLVITTAYPQAISADGSVVVGESYSTSDNSYHAWRWTADGGVQTLGSLPGGEAGSDANGVSADGSVIVGLATNAQSENEAYRWTESSGMVGLGVLNLPGERHGSGATAVSADGRTIVGSSYGVPANTPSGDIMEPFLWRADIGMVSLGDLPNGWHYSNAYAVSGDGSVVVGSSLTSPYPEAFIWDATHGMRSLRDVLTADFGVNLDGWVLQEATGISDDGLTIVGNGLNPAGQWEGWVAVVPEPATGMVMSLSLVFFWKRRRWRR